MRKIDDKSKVGIAVHTFGVIDPQVYFNHMGSMLSWAKKFNVMFFGIDKHRVSKARNILVETALSAGCSHLVFVDADHIVPGHMIEVLSLNVDSQIASGLVVRRRPPFTQVGFGMVNGKYLNVNLPVDGRSYKVDCPAMGCTMFEREVFERIEKPWFLNVVGETEDGESYEKRSDVWFFERARKKGIRMCIDTRVVIGHVGDAEVHYPGDQVDKTSLNRQYGIRMDADSLTWQVPVYGKAKDLVDTGGIRNVLDLGCGNPIKLKGLKAEIVGVDFQEKIEAISRRGVDGTWIGKDLNFPFDLGRRFDLIIAADVIEHVGQVEDFFGNVERHLDDNGLFLISSPEASTTGGNNLLHVQEFKLEQMLGVLGAHGFEIVDATQYEEVHGEIKYTNNVFVCRRAKKGD